MNRLLALFLLLASPAYAQMTLSGVGGGFGAAAGGAFVGPGDVISGAKGFWSCGRAYNAAYATATGNLCDIVDTATGTFSCTVKAKTNGFADLTSLLCTGGTLSVTTFCTVTHAAGCSVSRMYDQSGALACASGVAACNLEQATLATMPLFTFNVLNSLPCLTVAASFMLTPNPIVLAQPFSVSIVSKRTGNTGNITRMLSDPSGSPEADYNNAVNQVVMFAGALTTAVTASDNAFHGFQFVFNNTASAISVSNVATTGLTAGTAAYANGFAIASGGMTGNWCEGGNWPVAFSAGQQTSMFNNQNGSSGYNGGL